MSRQPSALLFKLWPSFADLAFALPMVFLFGRMNGTGTLLADGDTGWHIRTGEWIAAHHQVPLRDIFSFTKAGEPWYAWEWLSDILMALFHRWQGLTGVVFLFTVCIGLAIWLCLRLHLRLGGDFFLACVMASPLIATAEIPLTGYHADEIGSYANAAIRAIIGAARRYRRE